MPMIEIYPFEDRAKLIINGEECREFELDEIYGLPCYRLEGETSVEDLFNIPLDKFPNDTTFEVNSRKEILQYFKFFELTRKGDIFYTSFVCSLYPLEWSFPWNINSFFKAIEEATYAIAGNGADFINELDEDFSYYHFCINLKTEANKVCLGEIIKKHVNTIKKIHDSTCSKLERDSKNEDIIEIKPNFFGLGINVNALFRWLFKRNG
ncbi:MAG: hypothetical protein AB7D06_01540 [Pedobacter sp.]